MKKVISLLMGVMATLQLTAQIPDQRKVKLSSSNVYGLLLKETQNQKILMVAREAFSTNHLSLTEWNGTQVWTLSENDFISDLTDMDFGETASGIIYFLDEEIGNVNTRLNLHTVDASGNTLLNMDYDPTTYLFQANIEDYQTDFLINYVYYEHNSLFKVDASGNILWTYSAPRDTVNNTYWNKSAMHVLSNGYTVIATTSGADMLISCISSTGVQLWSKLYSNTFPFQNISVTSNSLNEIIVASENNNMLYLTKLDISGFIFFNKNFTYNTTSYARISPGKISCTSDDKIITTSQYANVSGNDTLYKPLIAVFDPQGDFIKAVEITVEGSAIHTMMDNDSIIISTWDSKFFVTDTTLTLTCQSQPFTLIPATVVPFTILNAATLANPVIASSTGLSYSSGPPLIHDLYCETLSDNDVNEEKNIYRVYPNPVLSGGMLSVESKELLKEITLRDATGKLIQRFDHQKRNATLKLPSIEKGIYFLHLTTDKNISVEKIMIY